MPEALAPERFRVQFTADAEMRERIQRLQDLLRHRIPDGDLATVIDTALIELLTKLERRKFGATAAPRAGSSAGSSPGTRAEAPTKNQPQRKEPTDATASTAPWPNSASPASPAAPSRTIPPALRNVVWERDDRRCRFISTDGNRCSATCYLEFHHVVAFARGGGTTAENLELRCRAHNVHEAEIIGLGYRGP